jgi:hypothetical protein
MSFSSFKARIADAGFDRRTETRSTIELEATMRELEATMRELGASGVDATIINVSEHGFMAVADGHFDVGARVWLILPGGRDRANAVVKWTAGDRLGAEFAEPVSLELFQG